MDNRVEPRSLSSPPGETSRCLLSGAQWCKVIMKSYVCFGSTGRTHTHTPFSNNCHESSRLRKRCLWAKLIFPLSSGPLFLLRQLSSSHICHFFTCFSIHVPNFSGIPAPLRIWWRLWILSWRNADCIFSFVLICRDIYLPEANPWIV